MFALLTPVNRVRTPRRCPEFPRRERWLCRGRHSLCAVCRSHTSLWSISPAGMAHRRSPHPSRRSHRSAKHTHTDTHTHTQTYTFWLIFLSCSTFGEVWFFINSTLSQMIYKTHTHTHTHTSVSIHVLIWQYMTKEESDWSQRSRCVCVWVWVGVYSSPCLVVFKMTNSSFCLVSSPSFSVPLVPLSGEATYTHTHTHTHTRTRKHTLSLFHLSFPSSFHLSIKRSQCLLALGYSRPTLREIWYFFPFVWRPQVSVWLFNIKLRRAIGNILSLWVKARLGSSAPASLRRTLLLFVTLNCFRPKAPLFSKQICHLS